MSKRSAFRQGTLVFFSPERSNNKLAALPEVCDETEILSKKDAVGEKKSSKCEVGYRYL